jgi:hypothetical protein
VAPLWGLPPEAVNIGVADYMCHMGSDSCLRHAASVEAPLIVRIGDGGIGYVGLLDGPGVFAGSDLWAELPESFMAEYHRTLEWLAFDCALEDALTNIGGGFGTEHLLSDSQIGAAELRALAECVADVSHVSPLFLQVSVCDEDPLSTGVGRTVGSRANAVLELASGVTLCPELMAADPEPVLAASHAACARRWLVALALAPDEGSHLTGWCATCRIAFQEQFYVERASPN